MQLRKAVVLGFCALLLSTVSRSTICLADEYLFTFSDTSGDAAHGLLSGTDSGLGDGSLLVTGGFIDVTASSNASLLGSYAIAPGGPGVVNGPNFFYDQLLYPADNAGSGANNTGCCNGAIIGNPSYLDNYGLVFGDQVISGPAVAIWGNGGGDYAFYGWTAAGGYNPAVNNGGTFTIQAVPEPSERSSLIVGLVAGIGFVGYRIHRRSKA